MTLIDLDLEVLPLSDVEFAFGGKAIITKGKEKTLSPIRKLRNLKEKDRDLQPVW